MASRICKGCGWEFPQSVSLASCRFCGTKFEEGPCAKCGVYLDKYTNRHRLCSTCFAEKNLKENAGRYEAYLDKAKQRYEDWKLLMKAAPQELLTEAQWIEACSYFGGCSICGKEHIDTRGFFIPFREGGKYAAWNIIPMCAECNTLYRKQPNPFIYLDPNAGNGTGNTKRSLNDIAAYLQERMTK